MEALRMMDTLGFGIREVMFRGQARRYLPLPDFDLSDPKHVTLTLAGRFVDENYSRALLMHQDLSLWELCALDRVQKKLPVDDVVLRALRKRELVEGRKSALYVSAKVAEATDQKAQYIRNRNQGDAHYRKLILDYLNQDKTKTVSLAEVRETLLVYLPEVLTYEQKVIKLKNLMAAMRKAGQISSQGRGPAALWRVG
jgi:ATP-dependent DNA helicase RecG